MKEQILMALRIKTQGDLNHAQFMKFAWKQATNQASKDSFRA